MKAKRPCRFATLGVLLSAFLLFVVVCALCASAGAQTPTQNKVPPVVLKGARLIDGTGRPPIENSVLVIEGKQIVAAGKPGSVKSAKDAHMDDVTGKTIIAASFY